ncbi:MAG: helix-turn-helix transcriptional regulator [Clostridiales bacterium]|nr:helix-turn-helix transcriptional regulator [Clostridiales bacterium]
MAIDYKKTGNAISTLRQEMKLNQQGLAELMNVTHQAVSKWENGAALPDTPTLLALSKLFGVTMEELLLGEINKTTAKPIDSEFDAVKDYESENDSVKTEDEAENNDDTVNESADEESDTMDDETFNRVAYMLPFASREISDKLFLDVVGRHAVSAKRLAKIAPFVSRGVLTDHVIKLVKQGLDGQEAKNIVIALAPFIDQSAFDIMIEEGYAAIDDKLISSMIPFMSKEKINALINSMIKGKIEGKVNTQKNEISVKKSSDTERILDARMKIAVKAVENGNAFYLEEHADELTETQLEELSLMAVRNGDHDVLEAVLAAMQPQTVTRLLDKVSDIDDWEIIELIGEYL